MKGRRVLWQKKTQIIGWRSPFDNAEKKHSSIKKKKHAWIGRVFRVHKTGETFTVKKIAITPYGVVIVDPSDSKVAFDLTMGYFVK